MSSFTPPPVPRVPEIAIDDLARADAERSVLLDVRQPYEYTAGHVPGAKLLPLDEVIARIDEVPRDRTVYVICETGPRSARAVQYYRAQGIEAYNVTGGTKAWVDSNRPVAYGTAPE